MIKKISVLSSVIILFILCIAKTYDVLGLNDNNTETEKILETDVVDNRQIKNNFNSNTFQDIDTGMRMEDGEFIYYNNDNYLMKYNPKTGKEEPVVANMEFKCLTNAEDSIYGVTTLMNGKGIDSDYLVKISKENGNTTILYKTECPHITSVIYDGEFVYFTNESHSIFKIDGKEVNEWIAANKSADFPIIIGMYKECMYITDGTQIEEINIKTIKRKTAYSELCSINQNPIMKNNCIYMFGNFNKNNIIRFNIDSKTSDTLIDKQFVDLVTRADEINSFSVSDKFIFFNCEGRLYKKELNSNDKAEFCKYINSLDSSSFGDYFFYILDGQVNLLDVI